MSTPPAPDASLRPDIAAASATPEPIGSEPVGPEPVGSVPNAAGSRRVLVVDDEPSIREVMRVALEGAGYEVRVLDGADEIEQRIAEWQPDLILCDVLMPGRDGLTVFSDLQRDPRTQQIPVVLATAKHFSGDQSSALQAGVAGYLVKPFEISLLLDTVRQALSGEKGVRIWGCRGAIATPEHAQGRFGGNTSCVELVLPAHATQGRRRIIFDAGTGIRALGNTIFEAPVRATLCLTHFHWDHIQGLPFFKPLYQAGNQITICGPAASDSALVQTIREQMGGAFFPISTDAFSSSVQYRGLQEQEFEDLGLRCSTFSVMHPGFTLAYKVQWQGQTIVYCPDNELRPESIGHDQNGGLVLSGEVARLAAWLQGVDTLLHDCQYSVDQYRAHTGWGHSSAHSLAALVAATGIKQVVLFHHDPDHGDSAIEAIHAEFRAHLEAMAPAEAAEVASHIASEGLFLPL